MMDWHEFIGCKRGLLIAPAGHGKTTTIADCLLQCPENSCQLVLTHTNAGISSLLKKFREKNVPTARYEIETITGFAQRYVLSLLGTEGLPSEDDKTYHDITVEKCRELLSKKLTQRIITKSYDGIFVDEYQDCSIPQHQMIMVLAMHIPLHLLGDPLQGIFSFDDKPLVDFSRNLNDFQQFDALDHPWRWDKSNPELGKEIKTMRHQLETTNSVVLQHVPDKGIVIEQFTDDEASNYRALTKIVNNSKSDSMLILYPSYHEVDKHGTNRLRGDIFDRIKLKQRIDFGRKLSIIDAIDSREYYAVANKIDEFMCLLSKNSKRTKFIAKFYDIMKMFHINKTDLDLWIDRSKNKFRNRTKGNAACSIKLNELFETLERSVAMPNLKSLFTAFLSLPKLKINHPDFTRTIVKCISLAETNNVTAYEAMKLLKGRTRHQGRKFARHCIGTTLLTKGLEFDTVIVWMAHKFEDAKNFYVAISRACSRLVIFTNTNTLTFN